MLVLTRKPGESVRIGSDVKVTLVSWQAGQARIAIEAPRDVGILREELWDRAVSANLAASRTSMRVPASVTAGASRPSRKGKEKTR